MKVCLACDERFQSEDSALPRLRQHAGRERLSSLRGRRGWDRRCLPRGLVRPTARAGGEEASGFTVATSSSSGRFTRISPAQRRSSKSVSRRRRPRRSPHAPAGSLARRRRALRCGCRSRAVSRVPDVQLYQLDGRRLPFEEEFDVVGAFDVLEHVDDDGLVLAQMHQATKPGGGIIVSVPQHPWLWSAVDEFSGTGAGIGRTSSSGASSRPGSAWSGGRRSCRCCFRCSRCHAGETAARPPTTRPPNTGSPGWPSGRSALP